MECVPVQKPPLIDQQKRERLTFAISQLESIDRGAHHKMIWPDETSVVLGKYGMQLVTGLKDEKFDKACLAYRFKKVMNFMFWGEIGYNFKGRCCILEWPTSEQIAEQNYLMK